MEAELKEEKSAALEPIAKSTRTESYYSDEHLVRELNKTGSWAAVMWERSASIGHLVVIDGFDHHGRLKIREPWDGTSYTMQLTDFLQVWSRIGLYARA